MQTIPKIIHQIWIGDKEMPVEEMKSIKELNNNYEYILWTEEEIKKRFMMFECTQQINIITDVRAKVDIMRIEILNKYGGIYVDADSYAISPFDDNLLNRQAFCGYENTKNRQNLIANGVIGFIPNHPLLKQLIDYYKTKINESSNEKEPWKVTGPLVFTEYVNKFIETIKNSNTNTNTDEDISRFITIFPDYFFYPIHFTNTINDMYDGHGKIYTCQLWNSTTNKISMNNLYKIMRPCYTIVSILMYLEDINFNNLSKCLTSFINQTGQIALDVHVILAKSLVMEGEVLKHDTYNKVYNILVNTSLNSRNIKFTLSRATDLVHDEISADNEEDVLKKVISSLQSNYVIKITENDILINNMISTLVDLMIQYPERNQMSGQIINIKGENIVSQTNYKTISYDMYNSRLDLDKKIEDVSEYKLMNLSTTIFRKRTLIDNNYSFNNQVNILNDYKIIYNIPNILAMHYINNNIQERSQEKVKTNDDSIIKPVRLSSVTEIE